MQQFNNWYKELESYWVQFSFDQFVSMQRDYIQEMRRSNLQQTIETPHIKRKLFYDTSLYPSHRKPIPKKKKKLVEKRLISSFSSNSLALNDSFGSTQQQQQQEYLYVVNLTKLEKSRLIALVRGWKVRRKMNSKKAREIISQIHDTQDLIREIPSQATSSFNSFQLRNFRKNCVEKLIQYMNDMEIITFDKQTDKERPKVFNYLKKSSSTKNFRKSPSVSPNRSHSNHLLQHIPHLNLTPIAEKSPPLSKRVFNVPSNSKISPRFNSSTYNSTNHLISPSTSNSSSNHNTPPRHMRRNSTSSDASISPIITVTPVRSNNTSFISEASGISISPGYFSGVTSPATGTPNANDYIIRTRPTIPHTN